MSGTFQIHKGKGALQAKLFLPKYNDKGFYAKEGAVYIEMAPGIGTKEAPAWDWTKKLNFAIGMADIAILIDDSKKPRLLHDTGQEIKVLEFIPGKEQYEGTYMVNLTSTKGETKQTISVSFTAGEYDIFMTLIKAAVPYIVGWIEPANA